MVFKTFIDCVHDEFSNLGPEDFVKGWINACDSRSFVIGHGLDKVHDFLLCERLFKVVVFSFCDFGGLDALHEILKVGEVVATFFVLKQCVVDLKDVVVHCLLVLAEGEVVRLVYIHF